MYDYYNEDYLMHYGVKGMKWGVRRKYYNADGSLNKAGQAKQEYKSAKKEFRTINRQAHMPAVGIKGIDRYNKANANLNKAAYKVAETKANLKSATAKNSEKAAKAEFKVYKNAMSKTGIRGSAADTASKGRSTEMYNEIARKKGKAYADRVERRVQNEAYATIAASAAVMVGSNIALAMLER